MDEIKDLSRFNETPTQIVLKQAEEVHKVNKIDIIEDGEVKDVAERVSKVSDNTKGFDSDVVEGVVKKIDGTLEGDLKRFTKAVSEKVAFEAVEKSRKLQKRILGRLWNLWRQLHKRFLEK